MRNSIFKSYTKKILRSEAFISVIIVFVLALGIIGTSYALYMDVDTDTNYQLVEVGDLSIGFDNGENTITLENMTPMEDEIALKENGNLFSFYIYNTGTYTTDYDIKLVPDDTNGNTVASEYINYQICKDNSENCTEVKTLGENSLIYTDTLSPKKETDVSNPSAYYFLRLWINNQYKETSGGTIKYNVEISAKNASGYLDNKNTLAGAILNNPNITINNNVPSFDSIADYKITGDATSGELGLFKAEDDYGVSYYFRGAQSNNYVNFAGMCWRVVRIAGDGSTKLILQDNNATCNSTAYTGNWSIGDGNFGYEEKNVDGDSSNESIMNYLKPVTEVDKSMVKAFYDFQTTKLADYTGELKTGDWCLVDKAYTRSDSSGSYTYAPLAENNYSSIMYYDSYVRLSGNSVDGYQPTLKCNGTVLDKFESVTYNGTEIIGEAPMYVGALTADEVAFAGGKFDTVNPNYYLIDINHRIGDFWLFSPDRYFNISNYDIIFSVGVYGYLKSERQVYFNISFRPVVSLLSGIRISGGNGTKTEPYIINDN